MVKWDKIPKVEEPWLKHYPKDLPRNLDYPEITVDEVLNKNALEHPDSNAIYFEGAYITFKELNGLVNQFAAALAKMGIKKGDVILMDMPNIPQFIISFYGILRANAIPNPIIPLNKFAEIVHQANDSKAKALIVLDFLYKEYFEGNDLSKMKNLEFVIMTGSAEYLSPIKAKLGTAFGKIPRMKVWPEKVGDVVFHKFQDVLASGANAEPPTKDIDPHEDPAVLIYTGGTTGSPKGCINTHFNLVANSMQGQVFTNKQLHLEHYKGNGGMIVVLPMAHSFGLCIAMNTGYNFGLKMILFPRPPSKISDILKISMKEKAIFCPGVPTLWNRINQDPTSEKYKGKMPDFKGCLSGAASLPFEVKKEFEELTGALITEGYGMSEASPLLTGNPFMRPRPNTVGVPVSDTYLKIVDIETRDIKPNCPHTEPYCSEKCGGDEAQHIGEICASGPQIMKGYLGRPEETAKALVKDKDGITWYNTADIGCIDCEGYLHIKDRLRDMIKYKGHSVFPREVEDLMYTYEPINEVGVYGVPSNDPEVGEIIKATVSLKEEYKGKVTKDDIIAWCKENISHFKYPREIQIAEDLPKSLIGKVLRRVLRDEELEAKKDAEE
ncbi:MAG: AMP-binding protein [Candidatus Hodarchaeota archaeon]